MSAIITNNFKIQNAINFTSVANDSNYYITIGKIDEWQDKSLKPTNTLATYRSLWNNMIGGKAISKDRVSLVIPRINWTQNVLYSMYDDADENLYNKNFYVMTDDRNVYVCLDNNNGEPSTIKPTGTGTANMELSDGYVWKYMYTVSIDDLAKFDVDNYIPITNSPIEGSNQSIIMKAAIPGTIDAIKVENGGLGYVNPVVNITGDGEGASAQAVLNGTSIEKIKILTPGKNYTYANIVITSDEEPTSIAETRAIIAPEGGHGSNPVNELYANRAMVSADLEYDEGGKLPITNDFRIVTILNNPKFREVGEDEDTETDVFSQLTKLQLANESTVGLFEEDKDIIGLASGATAKIVSINDNNVMSIINVSGKFIENETIQSGDNQAVINSITQPDLIPNSGNFIYIDYRKPISRAEDQKEKIRIILQF